VGCLVTWAFDKKIIKSERTELKKILLKVLGIDKINENMIKDKLKLSEKILKECQKLK